MTVEKREREEEKENTERENRNKTSDALTIRRSHIYIYIGDFRVERSLKSRAQLQLMHLLDQRASRSTSSIIDHPNARGTCTYPVHRVARVCKRIRPLPAQATPLFDSSFHPRRIDPTAFH